MASIVDRFMALKPETFAPAERGTRARRTEAGVLHVVITSAGTDHRRWRRGFRIPQFQSGR